MKRALLAALLTLAGVGVAFSEPPSKSIRDLMDEEEFKAAGLAKLSREELVRLSTWLDDYTRGACTEACSKLVHLKTNRAKPATIEKVRAFPERYDGKSLDFDNVHVGADLNREGEVFLMPVWSPKGTYVAPLLLDDGIAFVISRSLAEKFLDLEPDTNLRHAARVICRIRRAKLGYFVGYAAEVKRIIFYKAAGEVGRILED